MKRLCLGIYKRLRSVAGLLRHGPARLDLLEQRVERVEACFEDWHAQLASVVQVLGNKASMADLARQSQQLRDRLLVIESQTMVPPMDMAGENRRGTVGEEGHSAIEQAFYLALEQQFRGSEAQIGERLRVYRRWLDGLPPGTVADLGCGRGEWLGLLREWGVHAVGVDSNPLNVATIREMGYEAVEQDALSWLCSQPSGSHAAITAFHLVEHLSFADLLKLVDQARRVLKPGGRLIMETPNPENFYVSTQSFWLDPTHRRPLPPSLSEFVVAYCGLVVEAVPRLNPPEMQAAHVDPSLAPLLNVGRDYAVIAQRPFDDSPPWYGATAHPAPVSRQDGA